MADTLTSISLKTSTKKRIDSITIGKESYDETLVRLLKFFDEHQ